jgi:hypothetical protein
MAIGEIGMSIKEFYGITMKEWHYISKSYMIKDERASQKVRTHATMMVNLQLKKEDQLKPEQLWKLPSDNIIKVKKNIPTKQEMLEAAERYRKE